MFEPASTGSTTPSHRHGREPVEVIASRLYWSDMEIVSERSSIPDDTAREHYFCIDNELLYESFFRDFGPLHLGMVYKYCRIVQQKLAEAGSTGRRVVHCCSCDPHTRTNAALLICAYQVIANRVPADLAFAPFRGIVPPFAPFRDASNELASRFDLHIIDCLEGLECAIRHQWFDWTKFNVANYEFFSRVDKGDMNWIIPHKFLAFCGPSPTPIDADGYPAFTPEDYATIFRKVNIGLVVRLNKKQYERTRFTDRGIKHVDLYFKDGSCPSQEIISKFLLIAEREPQALAVHCKAGLGRTGTLIALYAMKHYGFPARAFIGWNRLCRPGSILGPQQQFLVNMQTNMMQAGIAMRCPQVLPSGFQEAEGIRLSLSDRSQAENYEDVGQGERLCSAKKGSYLVGSEEFGKGYQPFLAPKGRPFLTVGKCLLATDPNLNPKSVAAATWEGAY